MQRRLITNINHSDCTQSQQSNNEMKELKPKMRLRQKKRYLRLLLKGLAGILIALYVVVPLVVYLCPAIQRNLIFLSIVKRPWFFDFSHPESVDLAATRNFYIPSEDGIQLGVWHVLPRSFMKESVSDSWYENSLKDGPPIVIYLHGNAGSRASGHRVELYQVLRQIDVHVVAADYRGYGDSSSFTPSETGLVNDAIAVYKWVKERAGTSKIFIWGHSLGTGVSCHCVAQLNRNNEYPTGLVLEAPFSNMNDELVLHPLSSFFTVAPWYQWAASKSLVANDALFQSDKHIKSVKIPIVILHAEDDFIIPIRLGKKLYEAAVEDETNKRPVSFIKFSAEHRYNHQHMCRAPQLPQLIKRFINHPEEKLSLTN